MQPKFDPRPITLEGAQVRLEPLAAAHAEGLFAIGGDGPSWRWMPRPAFARIEETRAWIAEALDLAAGGTQIPFVIVHRASGALAGSTRYMDIQRDNRALEIGWTWLAVAHQRTPVNTECKYLLMRHAFEALGALRVQLKTDLRNVRSQNAIERIGAKREGVLRQHKVLWDGYVRDSVFFSVIGREWPDVKARLEAMLSR